ncbi:MAG: low molecular weight phosphatase family protein [Pseudomonadota bacterium]
MERLPQAVLFACNYNTVRSVMAVGLMQRRFGKTIWVDSCGARGGAEADPFVAVVMDELGVDVSRHRPKTFDLLDDLNFELIVTLTPEAHHKALELVRTVSSEVRYWPTLDPSLAQGARGQVLEEYRAVRDGLDRRIAETFRVD